jgi:hypothetical protein
MTTNEEKDDTLTLFIAYFEVKLSIVAGEVEPVLRITAKKLDVDLILPRCFSLVISPKAASTLTRLSPTLSELFSDLRSALLKQDGCSCSLTEHATQLLFHVVIPAGSRKLQFLLTLLLEPVSFQQQLIAVTNTCSDLKRRIRLLARQRGTEDDQFSSMHHPTLQRNNKNLVLVKASGGSGDVTGVVAGGPYSDGKHSITFQILDVVNTGNLCLFGILDENPKINLETRMHTYPGSSANPKGLALCKDKIYHNSTCTSYGFGRFGNGTLVTVSLNMDTHKISWTINGRNGQEYPAPAEAYYFTATVYSEGDAVRLLPELSEHSEE